MIKTTCRLCDSARLSCVVDFPPMPLVDSYSSEPNTQPLYPLALMLCGSCGHMQLSQVIAPELMYGKYLFRTADYPWMVSHYRALSDSAFKEFVPQFVLEIGSNDGTLLEFFRAKGCEVLGVDPSDVPADVPTRREYFGASVAADIGPRADLVLANHVFAHIDDLGSVVRAVLRVLKPRSGVFIFEAAYGLDLLRKHYFDTIYHEHLDYHTVAPLVEFFWRAGLALFRVEHNEAKGGSIRGFVCPLGAREPELSVQLALSLEVACGAREAETFDAWNARLRARREAVRRALDGERAIGYGASAGPIATMYHLGIADRIRWIVDDSPRRQGLYTPHANLEVKAPETLYAVRERDLAMQDGKAIILAWRYAEQVRAKHPNISFIVP